MQDNNQTSRKAKSCLQLMQLDVLDSPNLNLIENLLANLKLSFAQLLSLKLPSISTTADLYFYTSATLMI